MFHQNLARQVLLSFFQNCFYVLVSAVVCRIHILSLAIKE